MADAQRAVKNDRATDSGGSGAAVAYLINQYPKVSHTFIRREILALEAQGFAIDRYAIRGWDAQVEDEADRHEQARTRYLLAGGLLPLVSAVAAAFLRAPARVLGAAALALRMWRPSQRAWPFHLVYLAEACRLAGWLRQSQVVHLHAHFGTNSAEVAMLAHALGGPPYSFTVHGPEEFDAAHAIGLAEKIVRSAFVVAISSYGRSQLYRLVAHDQWGKVHVVHCGVDAAFRAAPPSLPPSPRRLVCVGRLCEQKGQLLLLDAVAGLVARGLDFELVLAGDGEMRPEIEARVDALGLRERVRITGWIGGSRVRDEILGARALVLPSFAEGLPVVIMEAMALRRPVISTYVAGIPELVRSGQDGWLVPAGDVGALQEAMLACIETPGDVLERMGEGARERVLARHSVDGEAAKLARLFDAVAEVPRAVGAR